MTKTIRIAAYVTLVIALVFLATGCVDQCEPGDCFIARGQDNEVHYYYCADGDLVPAAPPTIPEACPELGYDAEPTP